MVYKRRPLPITILAVIDGVLGSASTVLALYTATYLAGNPNPPQPENLLAALGVAAIGAAIATILIGVAVLGSLIGLALLPKLRKYLLWEEPPVETYELAVNHT